MVAKKNLSFRVPIELSSKLEKLSQETGISQTTIATEALAQYLGVPMEMVGDRLSKLEKDVAALRGKFKLLGS